MADTDQVVADTDQVVGNTDQVVANIDQVVAETDQVVADTDQVMADTDEVVGVDENCSPIEQLGKAFHELAALKSVAEDEVQWKEIEEHFLSLEAMIKKKSEDIETREKEFIEKESATHALLEEREAAVAGKEQYMLDRTQELKDAAVAAIAEARANHPPISFEHIDFSDIKESKVNSSSLGDKNAPTPTEDNSPQKTGENAEEVIVEVKPRPELMKFCEQMDAKALLNYTMENLKNLPTILAELSIALESANEPGRMVLDSLEGFYPPPTDADDSNKTNDDDAALIQGMRQSCIMFMEAMATLLVAKAEPETGSSDLLLNPEIKQQAKAIADEWNPKLAGIVNGNSLEAEAFLQLLATFRIASEFNEEELCKLVLAVSHLRRAPELCRSLGLVHKIPDVVADLVSSGKQIDAVPFIHAFQLTESFPLVPLLKAYLKDVRRNSQGKGGNSGGAAGAQNDVNAQELVALRGVIRCVREYKLEADYPLEPLKSRLKQLEKSKPDKKRFGETGKHPQSNKKPRANGGGGGGGGYRGHFGPPASVLSRQAYGGGLSERYHPLPAAVGNAYEYQPPAAYHPQHSAYDQQRSYYYPQDERVVAAAASYNAAAPPASYGGGYAGSGVPSTNQPYM